MIKREEFLNPGKEYRVDVRWWLAEGFYTDETLKKDISMLDESGFGAIEFLAMEEPGADSAIYGWGSEEWVHDSGTVIEETTKRGMGFSMTSGTNWANANLISICPDDKAAAKELDYVTELLHGGEKRGGILPKPELLQDTIHEQTLVAVVAAKVLPDKDGEKMLDGRTIDLTGLVRRGANGGKEGLGTGDAEDENSGRDGFAGAELSWQAPEDGDYLIFYFWLHGTGQIARPSVSTSYTINYIDKYGVEAFKEYWNSHVLTEDLQKTIRKNGRGMMYMDSLELTTFGRGGQFWGYHFLEEFRARRGYELTPYLPFIVKNGGQVPDVFIYHYHMEDTVKEDKIKNDLYQTMTDCYMENMLKPMQEWLHSRGMQLRAEVAYGLPFEVSQSGKYVDGIETESLEFASQIDSYRGMSGSAHIYNKIFSSETGATKLNYMMGLDFYTQIMYTQFCVGVSRTVLHGYSSICGSEESTYWPGHEGMWPIFSERFGCRQPAYQHYNDWTDAMARYQMMIRRGKPRVDLGILRLDYYFNNLIMTDDEMNQYAHRQMRGDEAFYWKDMNLQHAGYTWDYFAPQLLEEDFTRVERGELYPEGPGYQALIIYQDYMPVAAAKRLLELAKAGLKLVFVNGANETLRPGGINKTHEKAACRSPFLSESDGELRKIIEEIKALPGVMETDVQSKTIACLKALGVEPRARFAEPNKNILTFMNQCGDETGLFVYNMLYAETKPFTVTVEVAGGGMPYLVNCWNAQITPLDGKRIEEEAGNAKDRDGASREEPAEGGHGASQSRTGVTLTLNPGEAAMLLFDRKGQAGEAGPDSGEKQPERKVYGDVIDLQKWNLTVEDWNEGEKKVIEEDRGLGIVTREVYYETRKTPIEVGCVELKPWKDYEAVGRDVSGVGYYTTIATLPESWSEKDEAELCIGSTGGNTAAVYVNDKKADAYDFNHRVLDISALLHAGENKIMVEVSSTLTNRLISRGYYVMTEEYSRRLAGSANNAHNVEDSTASTMSFSVSPEYQDYGMTGKTELRLYKRG